MQVTIIRLPQVKGAFGHRSDASIYNAVKDGTLTKPVPIGQRAVGWPSDEVQAVVAARIAGMSEAEIRDLVNRLHAKRAELLATI